MLSQAACLIALCTVGILLGLQYDWGQGRGKASWFSVHHRKPVLFPPSCSPSFLCPASFPLPPHEAFSCLTLPLLCTLCALLACLDKLCPPLGAWRGVPDLVLPSETQQSIGSRQPMARNYLCLPYHLQKQVGLACRQTRPRN
jgi:hypothetical protein